MDLVEGKFPTLTTICKYAQQLKCKKPYIQIPEDLKDEAIELSNSISFSLNVEVGTPVLITSGSIENGGAYCCVDSIGAKLCNCGNILYCYRLYF